VDYSDDPYRTTCLNCRYTTRWLRAAKEAGYELRRRLREAAREEGEDGE
jgi:hypothetical protein